MLIKVGAEYPGVITHLFMDVGLLVVQLSKFTEVKIKKNFGLPVETKLTSNRLLVYLRQWNEVELTCVLSAKDAGHRALEKGMDSYVTHKVWKMANLLPRLPTE